MDSNIYKSLGTSNKRREKSSDHRKLRTLFSKEWYFVRDFCNISPDKIKNWQFNRIKELVKYAYEKVPLYKEKYSGVDFIPNDLNIPQLHVIIYLEKQLSLLNFFDYQQSLIIC